MQKIGNAVITIWDNLQNDAASADLLELLDTAESDSQLKDGIRQGVARLRAIGKTDLAAQIEADTQGFAF